MSVTETTAPLAPTGTWEVDKTHSAVSFEIEHSGISTFRGGFGDYDATLTGGEQPSLEGSARVASAVVQDENLAGHLQSPDFFDAQRNPEIRFTATELRKLDGGRVEGTGELTIKGVTKPIELTGRVTGPVTDPYGNERLGLRLETTVDRTSYGITWNAPMPSGGNILADDVRLTAELELVQAQGA
jgi:polyisoprenoid-binding protein YceI